MPAADHADCRCPCFCEPTSPRIIEMAGSIFTSQMAFNADMSQKNHLNMNNLFLAEAQNSMEKHGLADTISQLRMVGTVPPATT